MKKQMKFTTIANTKNDTGLSYLGNINKSAKLAKNGKISHQYTYSIYLAPANISGYNVCSHSTPECRLNCLHTSGRNGMEIISGVKTMTNDCRIKKTRLFYEHPEYFMTWMLAEIERFKAKAIKNGYGFSIRLNCTSDINWQTVLINGKNLFELYSNVVFYDYSKNPAKFINKPANYHLTFSYTGRNDLSCKALLKQGFNCAVVFDIKKESELPKTFMGYPVINGDRTDYRVNDPKGVIVGLKFKRIANQKTEKGCFVVNPMTDERCQNVNVHENELVLV